MKQLNTLTDLKVLAQTCNLGELLDSLLRDRIVCGINDAVLRERLFRETDLTLDKCLAICRAAALSKENLKCVEKSHSHDDS